MASYYFSADIISRGNGGSVAAASAYITGEKLRDIYDNKIHDRSYRKDVIHRETLLPPGAPHRLLDRQTRLDELNASEQREDSQMARIMKIALQNEFPLDEYLDKNIALIKEFLLENFINVGMCADFAIHTGLLDESKKPVSIEAVHKRENNPHAHIIVPFRPVDRNGFHRTKTQTRYMNNPAYLTLWRKEWARLLNREFERLGLDIRVTHESLAAQGIDREPTIHIGAGAMALELRGIQTTLGDKYREIMAHNKEREMERELERESEREPERVVEREPEREPERQYDRQRTRDFDRDR